MNSKFLPSQPLLSDGVREFFPASLVRMVIGAVVFLLFAACYVFADDGTAATTTTESSVITYIWNLIVPVLMLIVSVLGPVAGSYIVAQLIGLLGTTSQSKKLEIEDHLRWVLHTAALNGLKYAFTKAGLPLTAQPTAEVIADALFYVQSKNPDTVATLNLDQDSLTHILLAKLPDLAAGVSTLISGELATATAGSAPAAAAPDPAAVPTASPIPA